MELVATLAFILWAFICDANDIFLLAQLALCILLFECEIFFANMFGLVFNAAKTFMLSI